jgi:hypothetical protein
MEFSLNTSSNGLEFLQKSSSNASTLPQSNSGLILGINTQVLFVQAQSNGIHKLLADAAQFYGWNYGVQREICKQSCSHIL